MYILADIKEIEENQDLYRNKDDFFQIQNEFLLFNVKDLYFLSISVKYIFWQI